jgi:hypothetical protein
MKYIITESQYKSIMSERFKVSKDERTIISDTENFLQVVPLTESASCKYGAGTKWCVTSKENNKFSWYKEKGWDVSMVMIKNPDIQNIFGTTKFAFNLWNQYIEVHNDQNKYFNLAKVSEEAGVLDEVKLIVDDYINFMKTNRNVEVVKNTVV